MRIDKFLNAVNITKRRTIAQDMIDNKVIKIAGIPVKASRNVKVGDIIEKLLKKKSLLFIIKRFKNQIKEKLCFIVREI